MSTDRVIQYVQDVINDPKYGWDLEWVRMNLQESHLYTIAENS